MHLPKSLLNQLRLPVVGAPMFLVSSPKLVISQCCSGIIGTFPTLNARPQETLRSWIQEIKEGCLKYKEQHPQSTVAPFGINLVALDSNKRLEHDLNICLEEKVPIVITSMRAPSDISQAIHSYGGIHFHDVIKKKKLESFRRHCQRLVDRATLVGTMSKTIQDIDIVGLLGCPPEKVRIVTGAIPTNFGKPLSRDELLRQFPVAGRPYILYPAGYRSYKNHGVLIEALAQLHAEGHPDLELVFTGFTGMPNELARQIASVNLSGRVHAVGVVKRSELAGLYQQAAVTVVPSLYEQGSYPIVEAIHWGCPAACSGIAALREYLEPLDNTVPFFDPRSAAELCRVVIGVLSDRTNTVSIQQAALKHMSKRTWQAVAEDWRNVLLEAIQRSGRDNSV